MRLRAEQIVKFAQEHRPDIIALQEIKCQKHEFPKEIFHQAGYEYIEISGQKGMHGVATLSKLPLVRIDKNFCPEGHARNVSTIVDFGDNSFELHNFYIPAGGDEANPEINPKFAHKLKFLDIMTNYFQNQSQKNTRQIIVGDFNIAPHENDVWSHKQLLNVVSHTPVEVEKLAKLQMANNFTDTARLFASDDEKLYSWWSYRARDINKSDRGRRLDHIWVSPSLHSAVEKAGAGSHTLLRECRLWDRPSDHVPVTQILDFS